MARALLRRPIDDTFSKACMAERATCNFADDLCIGSQLYDETRVAEAQACLDKPCAEMPACLKAAFGS